MIYLFLMGCISHQGATNVPGKYSEDLSLVRPKPESLALDTTVMVQPVEQRRASPYVEPKYAVNKKLDQVLDSIDRINLTNKYLEGFTIQIFSGAGREEALSIKRQLTNALPEVQSEVQFVEPNFRVKAGKYVNRLEAQKDYMAIKQYFPNAIVIPDRIVLN